MQMLDSRSGSGQPGSSAPTNKNANTVEIDDSFDDMDDDLPF